MHVPACLGRSATPGSCGPAAAARAPLRPSLPGPAISDGSRHNSASQGFRRGAAGAQGHAWHAWLHHIAPPALRLAPCRVTNTADEIFRAVGKEPPNAEQEEILVSELQVHNPELGILENRVGKLYLDELFNDSGVDLEETAYWFHTPPGGWKSEPVVREAAEEAPVTFPEPLHADAAAEGRALLEDLSEGSVVTGTISDCWLYHGIQVDFGGECDGLVPIPQDVWMEPGVRETLTPGDTVTARVVAVRRPGLYRWPVQLQLLEPAAIAAALPPPEAYVPPIDHGWCAEQGWGLEDICAATGRNFQASLYQMPLDHAVDMAGMEMAYGYDDDDSNIFLQDPITEYMLGTGQTLIAQSMADATIWQQQQMR